MLIRLAFHFIASAPASGCLAGDVRPEHQHLAAAGVGHLVKNLGSKKWQRRLCLLKDACLYFYINVFFAFG